MQKKDILIKLEGGIFSYRVAGILLLNKMVLLQRPVNETSYAFPGGHVNFGETSQEALIREFKEEIEPDIVPFQLLWVEENFFPWGEERCHQICFYYLVTLCYAAQIPLQGSFPMPNELERKISNLEFFWIPLPALDRLPVYPTDAKERLMKLPKRTEHFIVQGHFPKR